MRSPTKPASPLKTCRCGATHDEAAWSALPLVGMQDAGEPGLDYELRNCRCRSTLAIERRRTEAA